MDQSWGGPPGPRATPWSPLRHWTNDNRRDSGTLLINRGADPLVRERPPGRRCRTGPTILAGLAHQTCSHWVLFDVVPDTLEFALLPHHVIVALFLPKCFSGQCQLYVGSLGSDAL